MPTLYRGATCVNYGKQIGNERRAFREVIDCQRGSRSACVIGTFARPLDSALKMLLFGGLADRLPYMALEPLETAEGYEDVAVRQQSIFVENRVGQLLRLTKLFERTDIRILAVSVVYSVDCAICRMILDDPDKACELLTQAGFKYSETELIVVSLPRGKRALLHTWMALLAAEINIYYTYPLLIHPRNCAAIAILPDSIGQAVQTLRQKKFEVLTQEALFETRHEG